MISEKTGKNKMQKVMLYLGMSTRIASTRQGKREGYAADGAWVCRNSPSVYFFRSWEETASDRTNARTAHRCSSRVGSGILGGLGLLLRPE